MITYLNDNYIKTLLLSDEKYFLAMNVMTAGRGTITGNTALPVRPLSGLPP